MIAGYLTVQRISSPRLTCRATQICRTAVARPVDSDTPRHTPEIACSGGIIRKEIDPHRTLGTG
jgi:hypothetical protein